MFKFSNKFGSVTLLPVTAILPIAQVSFAAMKDVITPVLFPMEQAEQLALITENKKIQISFCKGLKSAYVIYHITPNTVQICALHQMIFVAALGESAEQTISRLAQQQPRMVS